eukprot:6601011-Karenia_brevis.AAC.1
MGSFDGVVPIPAAPVAMVNWDKHRPIPCEELKKFLPLRSTSLVVCFKRLAPTSEKCTRAAPCTL